MHRIGRMRPIVIAIVLSGVLAPRLLAQGRPVTPADQAAGEAWWAHVKALADDSMEGRLTGSEGSIPSWATWRGASPTIPAALITSNRVSSTASKSERVAGREGCLHAAGTKAVRLQRGMSIIGRDFCR